jgi:hypothetical protein
MEQNFLQEPCLKGASAEEKPGARLATRRQVRVTIDLDRLVHQWQTSGHQHSLDSACALNSQILRTLHEDQIFQMITFSAGHGPEHHGVSFRLAFSSRSGIATALTTCRLRPPRRSECRGAGPFTRRSAPCAISCQITFSRCFRWWRWNHPSALTPPPFVQRRLNCWPLFRRSNRRRYGVSKAPPLSPLFPTTKSDGSSTWQVTRKNRMALSIFFRSKVISRG